MHQPLAVVGPPPPPPGGHQAGGPGGPGGGGGPAGRRSWTPAAVVPGCCPRGGRSGELLLAMAAPWGHVLLYHVALGESMG